MQNTASYPGTWFGGLSGTMRGQQTVTEPHTSTRMDRRDFDIEPLCQDAEAYSRRDSVQTAERIRLDRLPRVSPAPARQSSQQSTGGPEGIG